MSQSAIKTAELGKMYRLHRARLLKQTFREAVMSSVARPFRWIGRPGGLGGLQSAEAKDIIWALKNVSLEIDEGVGVGIIGRNGSGKSTLLKILSRITSPSSGVAEVTGKVGSLLEVGTGFHQELTGRENIYLSGAILGMKRREIDTKLDRIVDFSGVERFLDTPLKFYSTGMYLRIAFSVAAHLETDVMLVDEVLAVGDAEFQKKCLRKMKELAREGRTVLFVSHNLPAVASLCSRGLLLDAGRLVYQGSIQETINAYGRLIAEPEQESAGFPINAVQISGLKLEQSSGDLTSEEWWSICFRLNLGDTFEHVALQLGITTYDGRNLALDLIDSGSRPKLRIAGSRKVRIRIPPLWLKPQTYTARIKVYVNRSAGEIERFFSDWLTIHVNASSGETVQSDALLAPLCEWTIGSISESDE